MARQVEGVWFRQSKDTWHYTANGKSASTGVKGKCNRQQAMKVWLQRLNDNTNSPPTNDSPTNDTHATTNKPTTVRELADAFLSDAVLRLKSRTVELYRLHLDALCTSLGDIQSDRLNATHLTQWVAGLNVNDTTKAMMLRSVSSCLGWAVKNDLLNMNPAKKVHKPKSRSRTAETVISDADHRKLLAAANPSLRLLLRVLHATGCRPGEASKIATDNFDPVNGVVKLYEHKADRTGHARLIFLPPDIVKVLQKEAKRVGSGAILRQHTGEPWDSLAVADAVRRLRKQTGVHVIAYGYRHTYATDALVRGVPDATVAALLGHTSTLMLHRHYSHLTSQTQAMRDAVARVRG